MTDLRSVRRALSGAALIAALALFAAGAPAYAQTMTPQYAPPPPPPQAAYYLPPAMDESVADLPEPCGGDFGMLEKIEAARHDVSQVSPTGGPYCN
jgi:hypothetical protein